MTKFQPIADADTDIDDQDVDESEYAENAETDVDESTESESVSDTDVEDSADEVKESEEPLAKEEKPKAEVVKSKVNADSPYQVLYRRFRPHKFADIIGQDNTVKALRSAVINGTVANAYLFTGERGTGKTSTARVLASALNCPNVGSDGEPCGVCDLCVNVHAGNGSDGVTELDAASNSSVDDARRIINEIQFASAAKKNIYIIDEVHLLSKQANGTLLKTLEEPPPNVVFILCTTNPERLEPAIRSRTTMMPFRELDDTTMQKLISDVAKEADIDITADQIDGVVRRGRGSPRDALSALETLSLNTDAKVEHQNHASNITKAVAQKDVSKIIIGIAKGIDGGLSVNEISTSLLSYWRSMLLALNAPDVLKLTDKEFDEVSDIAETVGTDKIIFMLRSLGEAHSRLAQGDPRVMLETTMIQFVVPHTDVAAIRDIGRKLDALSDDVAEIKKRPTVSPFDSAASPVAKDSWPDAPEEKRARSSKADEEDEKPKAAQPEKDSKSEKKRIIEDPDDLIDAIFAAAPKSLQLVIPELEVLVKETTRDLLVLKSNRKRLSDSEFDTLSDAIGKVDPREFDIDEEEA